MKESRYCLSNHGHAPSLQTFIQILSYPGALQRVTVSLEDMHIISDPLLDEDREKCRRKTERQGHEPKRIDTDIGCRWIESRERGRWGSRDSELWDNKGNLLRDLGEHSDILLEIVHHLVWWVRFQILFAVDYE